MIEYNPFNKCKECVHEYCDQANMPCRACTFGSKFERAFIIPKLPIQWKGNFIIDEVSKLHPKNIIENIDKNSVHHDLMDATVYSYCANDVLTTQKMYEIMNRRIEKMKRPSIPEIKDVIFNPPATIVLWADKTKTVVKAQEGESFDPEKGLAMAICKKLYGNKGSFNNVFHEYIDKYEKKVRKERFKNIDEVNAYANDIHNAAKVAGEAVNKVMKAISDAVNKEKE